MNSRLTFALPVVVLGAALLAPCAHAQGRGGMRASGAGPRARSSYRFGGRQGLGNSFQNRYLNRSGYYLYPYFYDDADFEYGADTPEIVPIQVIVGQAAPSLAPPPGPGEPMLMEKRNGEWVRLATGNQLSSAQSSKSDSAPSTTTRSGVVEPPQVAPPPAPLPHAILVFHDGHMEEIGKYVIQGDFIYADTAGASTASSEKKIPIAQLDLPASLKLNKERGAKFNLPSGPNEVVIRF